MRPQKEMTLEAWEGELFQSEYEVLREVFPGEEALGLLLDATEVFDYIVQYKGGMATGWEIRSLLSRVYDLDL